MLLYIDNTERLKLDLHCLCGLDDRQVERVVKLLRDYIEPGRDKLDAVITAARRLRAAEVDAGACRTRRDWDDLHRQQDDFADLVGQLGEEA